MTTLDNAPILECPQGDDAFRALMAAPVSAKRKRIRKATVDAGESISAAHLSLADIYAKSLRGKRCPQSPLSKPVPTYRQWLARFLSPEDADRENARAKHEWTGIFIECPVHKPAARKSRSSWPSYREQTIAALKAAGEWEYLAEIGEIEIAEVIDLLPVPAEYQEAA